MSTLYVQSGPPVTVDVLDAGMNLLEQFPVSWINPGPGLPLDPGRYYVRARGLGGRAARVPVEVTQDDVYLDCDAIWTDARAVLSGTRPARRPGGRSMLEPELSEPDAGGAAFPPILLRADRIDFDADSQGFDADPGRGSSAPRERTRVAMAVPPAGYRLSPYWVPRPGAAPAEPPQLWFRTVDPDESGDAGSVVEADLDQRDGLAFLEIEADDANPFTGPQTPWTLSLPAFQAMLEARPDPGAGCPVIYQPREGGTDVLFSLMHSESNEMPVESLGAETVEAMVALQPDRDPDSAIEELAYRMVRGKFSLPSATLAAAGALYLLKINNLHRTRDWTRNIADYFPWLPDGAVVEGWRRLVSQDDRGNPAYPAWRRSSPPPPRAGWPDPDRPRPDAALVDAALRFAEAADRGPPVLALGLARLRDGINFCARRVPEDPAFPDLREALERAGRVVREWAALSRPAGAVTCFAAPLTQVMAGRDEASEPAQAFGEPLVIAGTGVTPQAIHRYLTDPEARLSASQSRHIAEIPSLAALFEAMSEQLGAVAVPALAETSAGEVTERVFDGMSLRLVPAERPRQVCLLASLRPDMVSARWMLVLQPVAGAMVKRLLPELDAEGHTILTLDLERDEDAALHAALTDPGTRGWLIALAQAAGEGD